MLSEVYASAPLVIVETRSKGIIDVSDDIMSVSITRRLDAVSSADVTLNNYATYNSGRYNKVINIGDRAHVSFYVDGHRVQQITGRVSRVPILSLREGSYRFTITDCIGDLQYIYWDPYSAEAQDKYTGMSTLMSYGEEFLNSSSGADGGIGTLMKDFLMNVCGFPDGSVKVAKFPDMGDTVKNIVKAIAKDKLSDEELEGLYQQYFDLIFGSGTDYSSDTDDSSSSDEGGTNAQKTIASNSASIVSKMFGFSAKASANDWNSAVGFAKRGHEYDEQKNWGEWDSSDHTGKYGLTRTQVKKYLGKDQDAWRLSESDQTRVMNAVMVDITKALGKSGQNETHAVWFYFSGQKLTYDSGGEQISSQWLLKIKGKIIKSKGVWEKLIGTNSDASSEKTTGQRKGNEEKSVRAIINDGGPSSSSSDMNKGSTPKPKISADAQKKWDTFIGRYHDGAPSIDYDNFAGVQCWDLYLEYFRIITNGATKPWQPADGNPGYWKHQCLNEPATMANFNRIGPGSRAQKGDVCFWDWGGGAAGHVDIVLSDDGTTLTTIDQNIQGYRGIVKQMTWKSGDSRKVGFLRPKIFANGAPSGGASGTSEGADGGSSGGSGSSSDPIRSSAFALFKYVTFWDSNKSLESDELSGELALSNDQPTFDYVKTLCNASFRSFMSMPDGSFAAFVPDYFGFLSKDYGINNVLEIPMVEVITFNSLFDKSSYVSHYYLLTNEQNGDPWSIGPGDSGIDKIIRLRRSSGVITLENPATAEALFKLMNAQQISGCSNAAEMLQKWGVSVKNESNDQIINSTMTSLYALFNFLKFWANCFTSTISITFKPEIMPGLRVRIPDAGTTYFVKAVTHSWSPTTGGRTSMTTVCPVSDNGQIGVNPS